MKTCDNMPEHAVDPRNKEATGYCLICGGSWYNDWSSSDDSPIARDINGDLLIGNYGDDDDDENAK